MTFQHDRQRNEWVEIERQPGYETFTNRSAAVKKANAGYRAYQDAFDEAYLQWERSQGMAQDLEEVQNRRNEPELFQHTDERRAWEAEAERYIDERPLPQEAAYQIRRKSDGIAISGHSTIDEANEVVWINEQTNKNNLQIWKRQPNGQYEEMTSEQVEADLTFQPMVNGPTQQEPSDRKKVGHHVVQENRQQGRGLASGL